MGKRENPSQVSLDAETDRRKGGVYRHRTERPSAKPVSLGEALRQVVVSLGLSEKWQEQRALSLWPQVVGEAIAAEAQAESLRRGELCISVVQDVWRQHLFMQRETLRQRLNKAVGNEVVRMIRFTKGTGASV